MWKERGLEDTAGLSVLSCVLHFNQARSTRLS